MLRKKSTILNKLKQMSRKDLEAIAKKRIKLKVRDDFKTSSWKKVEDGELLDKIAEICIQNEIYFKDLLHIKVLYKNKDEFLIQKRLGDIHYFEKILESAITKYGPSKSPDYEELARIAEIVYEYIDTVRFDNALGYPVYPNSSHLSRIRSIAGSLSTIDKKNLKTEESFKQFLKSINDEKKEADMAYYGDVMSR